jgi:putative ABC transport system permease protein
MRPGLIFRGLPMSDLRYTIRSLLRARWFTIAAVLTFAVGIGLNVAVFSIVDRLLFRPLPYGTADRLVLLRVCDRRGECYGGFPSVLAFELRERSRTLDGLAVAARSTAVRISDVPGELPLRLSGASQNLLRVLQTPPLLGRDFTHEDATEKRRVVLLTHASWQRRFGYDPRLLGASLGSGANAITIVGVLPPDFIPPSWTTMDPNTEGLLLETIGWGAIRRSGGIAVPVARLAHGVPLEAARAEVAAFVSALAPQLRNSSGELPLIRVDHIQGSLFSRFTDNAWLIVGAAGMLLLLACANLATLLMARGRSREQITAIHAAIGAGSVRLVRVAATEAIVVCLIGAAVAIVAVASASKALLAIVPPLFARYAAGVSDPRVLVVALSAALACAVTAGVVPALRATRVDVLSLLQRSSSTNRGKRLRGGRALLALEAALGVALVLSGLVMARSFMRLAGEELGYNPDGLYAVSLRPVSPASTLDPQARLLMYTRIVDALRNTPGIDMAAGADTAVPSGNGPMASLTKDDSIPGARYQVSATYFETLRTPLLAGRPFTDAEVRSSAQVAIIDLSAVRAFFPHEQPTAVVGRQITVDREQPRTVVGVVPDLKSHYDEATDPSLYLPLGAEPSQYAASMIRVARGTLPPLMEMQHRLSEALGLPVVPQTFSVAERLEATLSEPRFRAVLFSVLSGAALFLAAVGLFAVASFETVSRRYEMGVRLTLGAQRSQIRRMVLLDACRPVIVGVALGLVVAYWGERYLESFMYGMQPRDPVIYASVIAILLGTTVVAAWFPASRAARLDPADVLRAQ